MPRRKTRPTPSSPLKKEEGGFYDAYVDFARTLRLWFAAFGIGGPALFLTNDSARTTLFGSGSGRLVVYFFLSGVCLQIFVALLFKSAMWYLYLGEFDEKVKSWRRYKASDWLSECYAVEFFVDVVTLVLFGGAVLRLVEVFV